MARKKPPKRTPKGRGRPPKKAASPVKEVVKTPKHDSDVKEDSQQKHDIVSAPALQQAGTETPVLASPTRKRPPDLKAEAGDAKKNRHSGLRSSKSPLDKTLEERQAPDEPESPQSSFGIAREPPLLAGNETQSLHAIYQAVLARKIEHMADPTTRATRTSKAPSFYSNANYRRFVLKKNEIHMHADFPDSDFESVVKKIVNGDGTGTPPVALKKMAKRYSAKSLAMVKGLEVETAFATALNRLFEDFEIDGLRLLQNSSWRPELKPEHPNYESLLPSKPRDPYEEPRIAAATDDSPQNPLSPGNPQNDPPSQKSTMSCLIKTPQPDITLGIELDALHEAASNSEWSNFRVGQRLDMLTSKQELTVDGHLIPKLIISPGDAYADLVFPFFVSEVKSYCTGRQLFEAENQAAGAMACALNMLVWLDDKVCSATASPETDRHVVFSLTTEGPVHELWAHWTVVKDGFRVYECRLMGSWNALLPEQALDLVTKLRNVCFWGAGTFFDMVAAKTKKLL